MEDEQLAQPLSVRGHRELQSRPRGPTALLGSSGCWPVRPGPQTGSYRLSGDLPAASRLSLTLLLKHSSPPLPLTAKPYSWRPQSNGAWTRSCAPEEETPPQPPSVGGDCRTLFTLQPQSSPGSRPPGVKTPASLVPPALMAAALECGGSSRLYKEAVGHGGQGLAGWARVEGLTGPAPPACAGRVLHRRCTGTSPASARRPVPRVRVLLTLPAPAPPAGGVPWHEGGACANEELELGGTRMTCLILWWVNAEASSRGPPAVSRGTEPWWPQCHLFTNTPELASLPDVLPCVPMAPPGVTPTAHHLPSRPCLKVSLGRQVGGSAEKAGGSRTWGGLEGCNVARDMLACSSQEVVVLPWWVLGQPLGGRLYQTGTQTHMQELPDPRGQTNAQATERRGRHDSPCCTHSIWPSPVTGQMRG